MTKKIDKLTEEQEAKLPEHAKKWTDIGLSTKKCDRKKAEQNVIESYLIANKEPPKKIMWTKSPKDLIETDAFLKYMCENEYERTKKFFGSDESIDDFKAEYFDKVFPNIEKASLRESLSGVAYGSQDAHWLGFYNYFLEVLDFKECEKLYPIMQLAENCGWWIPREHVAILSEKPIYLELSNDNKKHSATRAAIEYADGFKIYALHDIVFEEELWKEIVEVKDPKKILGLDNVEQRMAALKTIGIENVLELTDSVMIDKGITSELWLIKDVFSKPEHFLKYSCPSTGRVYMSAIEPEVAKIGKADEVMAWKHNTNKEEYLEVFNKGMMS